MFRGQPERSFSRWFAAVLSLQTRVTSVTMAFINAPPLSVERNRHHGNSIRDRAHYDGSKKRTNIEYEPSSPTTTVLSAINLDELDTKAQAASEAWDMHVTSFMSPEDASDVENRLGNRADVACFRVGSLAPSQQQQPTRSRFLFTNPDLGMDISIANNEYCVSLCIQNIADIENLDPWPNILTNIGVDLDKVGDIFVDSVSNNAYLVVDPEIVKACTRLLPKELPGAVTVSQFDLDTEILPDENSLTLQDDMDVKRLDKRDQKRK